MKLRGSTMKRQAYPSTRVPFVLYSPSYTSGVSRSPTRHVRDHEGRSYRLSLGPAVE